MKLYHHASRRCSRLLNVNACAAGPDPVPSRLLKRIRAMALRFRGRRSLSHIRTRPTRLAPILICGIALLAAGCTVPEHMEVRAGADPRYQDDDVRFRTTYYFRVFDVCRNLNATGYQGTSIPDTDSLYRFRMTGKAFALFTNVHFEAGVLKSFEIDPFGANVVFDEGTGRFHFKSRKQTEQEAAREEREDKYRELQRLLSLLKLYEDQTGATSDTGAISDKIKGLIKLQLDDLAGQQLTEGGEPTGLTPAAQCPPGQVVRRGFQILGPEGWRTFDQDERLVLAMSSSGKPLISSIRELSARVLNEQPNQAALLLPLVEERLRISRTLRRIDDLEREEPMKSSEDIVKAVIERFEEDEEN